MYWLFLFGRGENRDLRRSELSINQEVAMTTAQELPGLQRQR
jgi:hypothetical protein